MAAQPLGRDHRVAAELEHEHAVGDAERERSAGAAFADDRGEDGDTQARHGGDGGADGLALSALLGADARVGARRVDEGEHREAELVGQLVHADGLAVPLGVGHPEVPLHVLLRPAALLVAHDDDAAAVEGGQAGDDGGVLAEAAVALELDPVGQEALHVVRRVGTVGVPRELHLLHRRQLGEELAGEARGLLLEAQELGLEAAVGGGEGAQLLHLVDEVDDGLLERQYKSGHGPEAIAER